MKRAGKADSAALALSALLTPAALMACALAFWRLGADLGITGVFAVRAGLFSHWQVWFAIAGFLELAAIVLNRIGTRVPANTTETKAYGMAAGSPQPPLAGSR